MILIDYKPGMYADRLRKIRSELRAIDPGARAYVQIKDYREFLRTELHVNGEIHSYACEPEEAFENYIKDNA